MREFLVDDEPEHKRPFVPSDVTFSCVNPGATNPDVSLQDVNHVLAYLETHSQYFKAGIVRGLAKAAGLATCGK